MVEQRWSHRIGAVYCTQETSLESSKGRYQRFIKVTFTHYDIVVIDVRKVVLVTARFTNLKTDSFSHCLCSLLKFVTRKYIFFIT